MVRRKVNAGKRMIWQTTPTTIDLGFRNISRNDDGLMPKATPNIIKARTRFIMSIPALFILTSIASMAEITSGVMGPSFAGGFARFVPKRVFCEGTFCGE